MWKKGLRRYEMKNGLKWEWQSMDRAITKAPFGGEGTIPKSNRSWQKRYKTKLVNG